MSQSDDKHRKDLKRRAKLSEKKRIEETQKARLREQSKYPEFKFEGEADPAFMKLIKETVGAIRFDSPEFPEWERKAYRIIKSQGGWEALQFVKEKESFGDTPNEQRNIHSFLSSLGNRVFIRAGALLQPFLKTNDVLISSPSNHISVEFKQLRSDSGPSQMGRTFFGPSEPTIDIDGQKYVCGFSRHAMDAICDRVAPTWKSYSGHGDAFFFFHDCSHFVPQRIKDKEGNMGWGFSLFQKMPIAVSWNVIPIHQLALGGLVKDDGSGLYVRIGYCPVALDGRYAKALTFIPPGFSKTPEAACYNAPNVPQDIKRQFRELGTSDDAGQGVFHSDPNLLRYFHANGFPQVVLGSDPCFAHIKPQPNSMSPFSF